MLQSPADEPVCIVDMGGAVGWCGFCSRRSETMIPRCGRSSAFLFPDFVAVNVGECDDLSASHQKPTAWYQKGLPEPRDGVPADLYANTMYCGLLEFVAIHGDEELLVVDCLLQSVLHKFHSLYAIHICQVVAQYPYSVYILRTVEKIISTGRT